VTVDFFDETSSDRVNLHVLTDALAL
jgi:hypothetical protein